MGKGRNETEPFVCNLPCSFTFCHFNNGKEDGALSHHLGKSYLTHLKL